MPISLNTPTTITIDKVRIDEFSVRTQNNSITIHFSKGYEDAAGQFVAKEFDRVDLKNVVVDPTLYGQIKDILYALLNDELAARLNEANDHQ